MARIKIDATKPLDIEIRADTLAVFRFTAQIRVPGKDFVDFATASETTQVSESIHRIRLPSPIESYTDIRIYFLIDGAAKRPYHITVTLSQGGENVADPIPCEGKIGKTGAVVFDQVQALLV